MALAIDPPKVTQTMLHYLRIAVTALCLTVCVLLIALWVRSYWWIDLLFIPSVDSSLASGWGTVQLCEMDDIANAMMLSHGHVHSISLNQMTLKEFPSILDSIVAFRFEDGICVPAWFLALITALLGVVPWPKQTYQRFSLRTLLIATTLIAVGLGLVVALS